VLQRIAEHAEGVDDDVSVADRLAKLVCELGQILVHGLPEERLDAFKAELDELTNGSRRIGRPCADHRADSDVQKLAHLSLISSFDRDASARFGALYRGENHGETADVVMADGLRL